jgi:chromosome segregation ATPase
MPDNFDDSIETEHQATEHPGHDAPHTHTNQHGSHKGILVALAIGLIISLAANASLWTRTSRADEQIASLRDSTQAQMSKLGDATTALLEQRLQGLNDQLNSAMHDTQNNLNAALKNNRSQAQRQSDDLRGKLEQQQQQVSGELTQLKDATTSADSKITEVSTDVNTVKSDVSGVKSEVATTQAGLEKTGSDLRRAMGDMGVMSGLIATNGKDLDALRALGERNYVEFNINKRQTEQKIGNITLKLKNADPKRNRYTVEIVADDQRVEKKDKTVNEPVQFYTSNNRQPYEIVVNQLKKDQIVGYLATPKVTIARQ